MKKTKENPMSFLSCFVQDRETMRVTSQIDELKDAGSTSSMMMKWERHDSQWYAHDFEWHATKILFHSTPSPHVVVSGPAGIVGIASPEGVIEEEIDPSLDGPSRRGDICDLRIIGDHVYVCGMSRQVYRREWKNHWTRQDEGVVKPRGSFDVVGFNAIDGLSEDDIFAVGFAGEIWRRQKSKWKQLSNPTNVVLSALRVVKSDLAFACGQHGVLLRGKGDAWAVCDHGGTDKDLWGLEWFQGKLYIASTDELYVLNEGDELEKVKLDLKGKFTFSHLHQNDGVLLSVGPKHVLYTEDGRHWIDTNA